MSDHNWALPNQHSSLAEHAPAPALQHELRPLSTGEVLDRTFFLYRSHFWLFTGLAALAAVVGVLGNIVKIVYLHFVHQAPGSPADSAASGLMVLLTLIPSFAVYAITQAATTSAVSSIYLGETTSASAAFHAVRRRWLRFVGISLAQLFSGFWLFTLLLIAAAVATPIAKNSKNTGLIMLAAVLVFAALAGLLYGLIAYIRNSLAVPAAVVEGIGIRASLRRSKHLIAGHKGRIFLLLLLIFALYVVAIVIQTPLAMMLPRSRSTQLILLQIVSIVVSFLATCFVSPIGAIALCLFYIDERVRKEAFDIDFLMNRTDQSAAAPLPPETQPPPNQPGAP